jgi:hypothetical protein
MSRMAARMNWPWSAAMIDANPAKTLPTVSRLGRM